MQAFLLEAGQNPEVDAVPRPLLIIHVGQSFGLGTDQGPVISVFGPLLDPAREDIDLGRTQAVARFSGGHAQGLVFLGDSCDQGTGIRVARDDGRFFTLEWFDRQIPLV